jgi:hypothetical protein
LAVSQQKKEEFDKKHRTLTLYKDQIDFLVSLEIPKVSIGFNN